MGSVPNNAASEEDNNLQECQAGAVWGVMEADVYNFKGHGGLELQGL